MNLRRWNSENGAEDGTQKMELKRRWRWNSEDELQHKELRKWNSKDGAQEIKLGRRIAGERT